MKRRTALIVGAAVMAVTAGLAPTATAQHIPDANTVLYDGYDGTSNGAEHGTVDYVPSLPTLGEAVDLDVGDWLKYSMPSWSTQQGTIEAWINPETYGYSIALLQWYNTNTAPSSGYIGHFNITPDGYLAWNSWGPPFPPAPTPLGTTVIPLGEWTHVAATWGPAGTNLYVNGQIDYSTASRWAPAMWFTTTYVYINDWGFRDHGLMDEFRISDVPRTAEEIEAYVDDTADSTPPDKEACKKGGWETYTDGDGTPFANQGDCVSYVVTGGRNLAQG
ncbi:MAG: LamG domain-containing protein [Ilumatobacter sp.]|nr:LamG domain-containing protein [Ilumatobacter sp.]